MARLFVAAWPPPSLIRRLRALARPPRDGLRWTTEDQWHMTLRFLGPVAADQESALRAALTLAAQRSAPLPVVAGPAPCVIGRTIWALPIDGLQPLAEQINALTVGVGEAPAHRHFRGHLTLARARRPQALAGLLPAPLAERWTVDEFTLVASDLRPEGARYEVLDRWPLGPR